ncbi:PREDICTED: NAD(P)H-hydrate epimerase [Vollenhovia emeryi]|uniref:NAD(P)H-hydrate epimerase n=1 Tax=Vollenhovia emeryi TaxID=411798 RepID=UPI0005F3EBE3|nr:PREDICTED: NAD(P)H-hydrate epimerase [Vollenhovia emeryi]XP_011865100.1 PREDICTED: NAD(P)H-hydrate epimerase [Vollenhovia emeryi]XP_011865101.1 PREDICTED: NAD(P)H-hydrate epimerase [Vollenhovia emeryi]XP_011865102.1 PREDICTED: NAD(P)H-hydrate epimerase [Vollenhovia emeryi]XP_011865103.1 PREDICTED: NAD(P)H-hydrate epimerase [Vollenhovia emeryi]
MLQLASRTLISRPYLARRRYSRMVRYLGQSEAINLDKDLFEKCRFSVDQLMELAGQSCAVAIAECFPPAAGAPNRVLVCCGPGNNGGDGLVCARHLKHYGYSPEIYYPKRPSNELYERLLHQCVENDIPVLENRRVEEAADSAALREYALVVDALMGFSFRPPMREPFVRIVDLLRATSVPVCSVDIPSGWDVERGPPEDGGIQPRLLVSLTAPKLGVTRFKGTHYLGGRFVPEKLASRYNLGLPDFAGTSLIVRLH